MILLQDSKGFCGLLEGSIEQVNRHGVRQQDVAEWKASPALAKEKQYFP